MKKLMIAAAIVCAAVSANAVQVNWGGAIAQPDGMTELNQNTPAYLVWSDAAFSTTASDIKFDGKYLRLKADDTVVASTVSTHTITGTEAGNWTFMETYTKAGSDVNGFYAALIYSQTDNMYSIYDLGQVTGTTPASDPTDLTVKWGAENDNWLTMGGYSVDFGSGPEPEPTPEPTSAILMALGLAGLALKRKQK